MSAADCEGFTAAAFDLLGRARVPEVLLVSVTAVLWQASDGGSEVCVLERALNGWRLRGTVLTHEAKQPIELRYAVTVDSAWATTDVEVLVALAGGEPRELAQLSGVWAGTERPPQYSDCVDVDLSFTPATTRFRSDASVSTSARRPRSMSPGSSGRSSASGACCSGMPDSRRTGTATPRTSSRPS
jgi:hypothetical protein